jgi:hypothetical protein
VWGHRRRTVASARSTGGLPATSWRWRRCNSPGPRWIQLGWPVPDVAASETAWRLLPMGYEWRDRCMWGRGCVPSLASWSSGRGEKVGNDLGREISPGEEKGITMSKKIPPLPFSSLG